MYTLGRRYQAENADQVEVLSIDNTSVRNKQVARLEKVRKERDEEKAQAALKAITESAKVRTALAGE